MTKGKTSLERAINKAMELGTVALKVDPRTYTSAAAMMARMSERLETAAPAVDSREASPLAQPVNSRRTLYGTAA